MSILNQQHPEIFTGYIENYGFHKVERQARTILKNILVEFFDKNNSMYKATIPEIEELENSSDITKLFIERDFPFFERKLPLIAIGASAKEEKKAYLGGDDLLYTENVNTSSGIIPRNWYGNWYKVNINLVVAALSTDMRQQIDELINMCFSHYYRWHYMYSDSEGNKFNITPNTSSITISGEREINDQSKTSLIYINTVNFTSLVEYIFSDVSDSALSFLPLNINNSGDRSYYSYQETDVPTYIYSSTGEIVGVSYYTSTALQPTDYKWWETDENLTTIIIPEKVPIDLS